MTNAQIETAILQRQAARLVEREVLACMSSLVAALCSGYGDIMQDNTGANRPLRDTIDQAMELSSLVFDYESAAREAGWQLAEIEGKGLWTAPDVGGQCFDTAQEACDRDGIEPHELEVYEHWAVSSWLAEKLIAKGERVDTDFAGLNVWARTTTGQSISLDSVIEAIVAETGYASAGA